MAARYQQLIEGVQARAGLPTAEDARSAVRDVIETVAVHLDGLDREQLRTALPATVDNAVELETVPAGRTRTAVVDEVAERSGVPAENARYRVKAVLSELAAEDPALARTLQHRLPGEVAELFSAPGQGPPPEWSAAGAGDQPRPLDADELQRALDELVNWAGNTERISREVSLPSDRWRPVWTLVKAAEEELSHNASIDQRGGGVVRFTLSTRSLGSVTELDLQLARRIDEAIDRVGSGG